MQRAQLLEQRFELDAAMRRRVRRQAAYGFRELSLHSDRPAASGLVPRDRDVHEPLQEIAFFERSDAPGVLELLVRREVLAPADQLETRFKPGRGSLRRRPVRRRS